MSQAWEQIISEHPEIEPELLMAYLEGRLSLEEQHRVERQMASSPFVSDAMEGLATMEDRRRLPVIVAGLNSQLRRKTLSRRRRLFRNAIGFPAWLIYATLLTLLLLAAAWLIFQRLLPGAP